jgi:hypothetical protein
MISDFLDMLKGDWGEKLVALLMAACVAVVVWLVCWGVFVAADSWFIDDREGTAEVCGHNYSPAWIQTIYHSNGNGGGWTQFIHHPESWAVVMRMGELSDSVTVSQRTHDEAQTGQKVPVRYRKGRFSDGLYITEARFR